MSQDKQLVHSILRFFEDQKLDAAELEVIESLTQQKFGVSLATKELSVPFSLAEIFNAGLATLKNEDPKFRIFIDALKKKGYFDGVAEGSAAHQERYNKAKEKFLNRAAESKPAESATTSQADVERRKQEADSLKNEGNNHMKNEEYNEAIAKYSKAIELVSDNAVYYSNRAAAYTCIDDFDKATEDGEAAIKIDPKYSKAYTRLATAQACQGNFKQATENYKKALELDPDNQSLRLELRRAEQHLAAEEAAATGGAAGGADPFGLGNFDLSQLSGIMNNPMFMNMAQQMMQNMNPEMMQSMMSGMGGGMGGMPNLANMMGGMGGGQPAAAPAAVTADDEAAAAGINPNMPGVMLPNIDPSVFAQFQNDPQIRDNPKMQRLIEEVRTQGPMATLKYMNDPEVLGVMSKIASQVMKKNNGDDNAGAGSV